MFTTKFVKLPIKVYNKDEQELTGKASMTDSYEHVSPFFISSYRESVDPPGAVSISFKDGTSMLVYMTLEEFETYMNNQTIFKP